MNEVVAFYLFGSIALIGAVNVVVRRNPVHSALFLVAAFLGVAGLFLSLDSALLAAIQVIVYAGAIMVLFLFVILLLNLEMEPFAGLSAARVASVGPPPMSQRMGPVYFAIGDAESVSNGVGEGDPHEPFGGRKKARFQGTKGEMSVSVSASSCTRSPSGTSIARSRPVVV